MKLKIVSLLLLVAVALTMVCAVPAIASADDSGFVVELTDYSINGFYAFSLDGAADVYQESRGQFFRMSYKGARYNCFYFSTEDLINGNGTYKLEFEARTSDDLATCNIFVGLLKEDLSQPCDWTIATSKNDIDAMPETSDGFHKVTLEFRIEDYYSQFYKFVKIGYDCTDNPSGYLDVDNIALYKGSELIYDESVNVDDTIGGDFENFTALTKDGDTYTIPGNGWTADGSYYNLFGYNENAIVMEDGNRFLKLYDSVKADTTITKKLSVDGLKEEGWYKLKIDLKGGADFYSDNIGFRIQADGQRGYHGPETNISVSSVKKNVWSTIEVEFYIPNTTSSSWINFDIWVFLRNNDANYASVDNYLAVDNIRFHKAQNTIEFGENLLADGDVEGFKASQGRKEWGLLSIEDYAYSRELIKKDFLESFDSNTKLTTSWASQNYLGTIDLDVPPVFGYEDDYYAMQLVHDGKSVVKTYASATYMLHNFDFTTKNCYKLSFDYKAISDDTDIIRFAFVSNDNEDDFMLDLYTATIGENKTNGVNKNVYTYVVKDNGDGWKNVELIFKPDAEFKSRVNSMRFLLMTNYNENNCFYIANFSLTEYSDQQLLPLKSSPSLDSEIVPDEDEDSDILIPILCGVGGVLVIGAAITTVLCIRKRKQHEKE